MLSARIEEITVRLAEMEKLIAQKTQHIIGALQKRGDTASAERHVLEMRVAADVLRSDLRKLPRSMLA